MKANKETREISSISKRNKQQEHSKQSYANEAGGRERRGVGVCGGGEEPGLILRAGGRKGMGDAARKWKQNEEKQMI